MEVFFLWPPFAFKAASISLQLQNCSPRPEEPPPFTVACRYSLLYLSPALLQTNCLLLQPNTPNLVYSAPTTCCLFYSSYVFIHSWVARPWFHVGGISFWLQLFSEDHLWPVDGCTWVLLVSASSDGTAAHLLISKGKRFCVFLICCTKEPVLYICLEISPQEKPCCCAINIGGSLAIWGLGWETEGSQLKSRYRQAREGALVAGGGAMNCWGTTEQGTKPPKKSRLYSFKLCVSPPQDCN